MIYLAYIVIAFTGIQLLVALMNVVFKQRLPKSSAQEVLVSILIPARNEEKTIGKLLNDLQQQDYQTIEVFVYNDQSSDNTANIVEQYVQKDARFHLINGSALPSDWLGKSRACHELAQHAQVLIFYFSMPMCVLKELLLGAP